MGPRQSTWVKAVQKRIAITSTVLRSMKSVKMMGLSDSMEELLQNERVNELKLAKPFRWLIVWLNVLGKSIRKGNDREE
jgi:ATP-binding cassette subfamily C (CFTR/MRP) protein 1